MILPELGQKRGGGGRWKMVSVQLHLHCLVYAVPCASQARVWLLFLNLHSENFKAPHTWILLKRIWSCLFHNTASWNEKQWHLLLRVFHSACPSQTSKANFWSALCNCIVQEPWKLHFCKSLENLHSRTSRMGGNRGRCDGGNCMFHFLVNSPPHTHTESYGSNLS